MIVSHRYGFIFLKTRKTAGTSIEVALSRLAGDDAIVTPVYPPEPGHRPRNYEAKPKGSPPSERLTYEFLRANPSYCHHLPYLTHMPAWAIREKVGAAVWDSYFKFCFERNPWDKVVSKYWWRNRDADRPPAFDEWVAAAPSVSSDWPIYSLDDSPAVDAIGRFENLGRDFGEILKTAGLPADLPLPRSKSGARRRQNLYSPESARRVGRLFRREIEHFGYRCSPDLMREVNAKPR